MFSTQLIKKMKLICIGKNYAAHIKEMGWKDNHEIALFMKPETALCKNNIVHYPSFSKDFQHEIELIIQVGRILKNCTIEEALKSIVRISVGIDFTARDIQKKLKDKGMPWEISKSFDESAIVGEWRSFHPEKTYGFWLEVNGKERQRGDSSMMIASFSQVLQEASRYFTIYPDDVIFTGTPEGVNSVSRGDVLCGFLDGEKLFEYRVL